MPTFKLIDEDVIGAGFRMRLEKALDLDGYKELAMQCEVTSHAGSTLTVTLAEALVNQAGDYASLISFTANAASGTSSRAYKTQFERFVIGKVDFSDPSNTANAATVRVNVVPKR